MALDEIFGGSPYEASIIAAPMARASSPRIARIAQNLAGPSIEIPWSARCANYGSGVGRSGSRTQMA
jgi:hypothetical protein